MPPKGLRDPKLTSKARPTNWTEGTKFNRTRHWICLGGVAFTALSTWACIVYRAPEVNREREVEIKNEDEELKEKNERYVRLITMRRSLEGLRQREVEQILAAKAAERKRV